MASVQPRRLRDGSLVHRVMFRIDGRQRSETFTDEVEAEAFRRLVDRVGGEAAIKIRDARNQRSTAPLLKDWLNTHLSQAHRITAGTAEDYRRLAARTWIPILGELPVNTITRQDVQDWIGYARTTIATTGPRRGQPMAPKSLANAHGLLSTVLASAVEAGHMPGNVARGLPLPAAEIDDKVFLTAGELAQLIHHIPEHWRPLVATMAGTGLRWGEASALQWGDVDLEGRPPTVRVVRAWKHGPKKARVLGRPKTRRSERTISLSPEVVALLDPLQRGHGDFVFTAINGGIVRHDNFYRHVWVPAVSRFAGDVVLDGEKIRGNGKRPRIHDLRHSHASALIADGVDVLIVQQRLGHESAQTTLDIYGHTQAHAGQIAAEASSHYLSAAFPVVEEALEITSTAALLPAATA